MNLTSSGFRMILGDKDGPPQGRWRACSWSSLNIVDGGLRQILLWPWYRSARLRNPPFGWLMAFFNIQQSEVDSRFYMKYWLMNVSRRLRKVSGKIASEVALVFCLSMTMLCSETMVSCTADEFLGPVVKLDLSKSISAAIKLVINTSEGAAGGNYLIGSRPPLVSAITSAQIVYASKTSTQIDLDNATKDLNTAVATYQSHIVVEIDPQNLVAQWTFDQIAVAILGVTVQDNSGHKNDGTMNAGHPYWGAGLPTVSLDRYGVETKALHFDKGANIEIPYNASLNPANMSIALWAKIDDIHPVLNNQYLVSMNRNSGYHFNFISTQRMTFSLNPAENPGGTLVGTNITQVAQGQWVHLVVTFGNGLMKFYVNGALDANIAMSGSFLQKAPGVNLVFGQDLPTNLYSLIPSDSNYLYGGGYFAGALDEIRIYKSVLTDNQVTSIYNLEKP